MTSMKSRGAYDEDRQRWDEFVHLNLATWVRLMKRTARWPDRYMVLLLLVRSRSTVCTLYGIRVTNVEMPDDSFLFPHRA